MKIFKRFGFFLGLLILVSCSQERSARKIPVEDFFKNPDKTAFQLSPDGQYISFLQPYEDHLNIFVQTIDGKNVTRLTSNKQQNIAYYFWANNNEILYLNDEHWSASPMLYAVKKDGSNTRDLISFKNGKIKIISKGRTPDKEVLVALNKRDSTVFDAYRLNIESGKLSLLVRNPGNITQWYADPNGKLRMALASDEVNETLLYRDTEKDPFKSIITNNFKTSITPIGFSEHKTCIYALSNQNRDKKALVEFNWQTGKEHKEIYSNAEVDVSEAVYSVSKKKIVYASYETWKKQRFYLDDEVKSMYQRLEKLLPNTEIRVIDRDSAEKKFILKTYTDRNPESFYLYTRTTNELVRLSDTNPPFVEDEMCEMKPISYKTRDGLLIHGYLTLPKGKSVGSSRVDLQACKLEYSIVSPK